MKSFSISILICMQKKYGILGGNKSMFKLETFGLIVSYPTVISMGF